MAAYNWHFEVCRLLIRKMVDKNPQNNAGITPLHFAAWSGDLSLAKLLQEESGQEVSWMHYLRFPRMFLEFGFGFFIAYILHT